MLGAAGVLAARPRRRSRATWRAITDPADLGVLEARRLLHRRELSSVELTRACLRRIEARNGGPPSFDGGPEAVNAWVRLYPAAALRAAARADRRLARGSARPPLLCGIPVGLKDLYGVRGLPLTASSRVLDGNVATQSSAVWVRLRAAGMVLVGHTHTHEFGAGATTDQVGNPWQLARSAGGSSGGSAAALAARMVPAATGTDTGGSLRFPAALCGVSAIKPTRGSVPTAATIPVARRLDHAGPMARTVADCAALLRAIGSSARLRRLPLAARGGRRPLRGLTVALTDRLDGRIVDPDVEDGVERAARALKRLGAAVVVRPAPRMAGVDDAGYSQIFDTDLWSYHERFVTRATLYRPTADLATVTAVVGAGRPDAAAELAREQVTALWARWFADQRVDLVLEPTAPWSTAPRGAGYLTGYPALAPLLEFAALWDATGFPVVALPAGVGSRGGAPLGVSLVAPARREAVAVRAGIELQARGLAPPVPRGLDSRLGG